VVPRQPLPTTSPLSPLPLFLYLCSLLSCCDPQSTAFHNVPFPAGENISSPCAEKYHHFYVGPSAVLYSTSPVRHLTIQALTVTKLDQASARLNKTRKEYRRCGGDIVSFFWAKGHKIEADP
jgi:hypothetical protein